MNWQGLDDPKGGDMDFKEALQRVEKLKQDAEASYERDFKKVMKYSPDNGAKEAYLLGYFEMTLARVLAGEKID